MKSEVTSGARGAVCLHVAAGPYSPIANAGCNKSRRAVVRSFFIPRQCVDGTVARVRDSARRRAKRVGWPGFRIADPNRFRIRVERGRLAHERPMHASAVSHAVESILSEQRYRFARSPIVRHSNSVDVARRENATPTLGLSAVLVPPDADVCSVSVDCVEQKKFSTSAKGARSVSLPKQAA